MRPRISRVAIWLTAVLLLQGVLYYAVAARPERTAPIQPLNLFPSTIGPWRMTVDVPIEKEIQDVLGADDLLNRVYAAPGSQILLFVGYFKTQRTGSSPHSPKNCLPGSGWEPADAGRISLEIPGRSDPAVVNRYLVARGDERSVVLYWYQSHNRVVASEFAAKFWLVADSIRYRRSDTALVKVVVPVTEDPAKSLDQAVTFVKTAFPELVKRLPS
jgi:EpsI family protein